MERTISAMIGKGSVNHNTRAFTAKNVDKNRSADNVEFCQEDIKQVYHKLFDEARERYNAKQKRKDRMIDNYYEKIRRGKQEKLFHEVIFQIGNKDDMNAKNEDGLLAKRILTEFMDEFQARNPNLYVFSAHLHMDEETPHLHIDFVPYITESKRGLDIRVSLKSALAAEGFLDKYFVEEIPQKFKYAYLQYYYICDFIEELNSANKTNYYIDKTLKNRSLRNCFAHYGLGQFLEEIEINEKDVLKGLTEKAFNMDYFSCKNLLYKYLVDLKSQIEETIF